MRPQANEPFQVFDQQLHLPPVPLYAQHLSRGDGLQPIGHEDGGLLGPLVAPTLTEHHRDVSQMAQPCEFGIGPTAAAALGVHGRNANLGILPARQMAAERFDRLPRVQLPGPGQGPHVPVTQYLDEGQIGPGGISPIGSDHQLLAPGGTPEIPQHLEKPRIFGLAVGSVGAPDQRNIHQDAIGLPGRHEERDPKAEDVGMVLAEAHLLGYRMLAPPFALENAVTHQMQDAVLGWAKGLQGLLGKPPQQCLRPPVGGPQQTAILLVGQMMSAMLGQSLQMGAFAIQEVPYQEPAKDQAGQGHGLGLLGDTSSDRPSRSSILGNTWAVKDFHTVNSANLSPLS
jgi:hypothetical protein